MIRWEDEYSVGFEGIDEQHKILISIIQEVDAEINSQSYHFNNLIDVVNKLEAYIKDHLTYEEELMKKYAYPETDQHILDHNVLRYKILSINFDNIRETKEFFIDTYTYLSNWLVNHIMKTDKALGKFIAEKGR